LASQSIHKDFCRHIIGRGGETLKKIRNASQAHVDLHRAGPTEPDILVVGGETQESVDKALSMVSSIIADQQKKVDEQKRREQEKEELERVKSQSSLASSERVSTTQQERTYPPGYSGRSKPKDAGGVAVSAPTMSQQASNVSSVTASASQSSWQSVPSRKSKKPEQPASVESTQKKESILKTVKAEIPRALPASPSAAETIVSTSETLVSYSLESANHAVSAPRKAVAQPTAIIEDEWQTVKGGKTIKADPDALEESSGKKKKKKNKKKAPVEGYSTLANGDAVTA
jgi:hypothetical protein